MSPSPNKPASQNRSQYGTPQPFSPTPRDPSVLRCGCMIVIVLVTIALLLTFAARSYVITRFGPEKLEEMKRNDREIVQFPAEWKLPQPLPSEEVVRFQFELYETITRMKNEYGLLLADGETTSNLFKRLVRGDEITSGEKELVRRFYDAYLPVMAETSASLHLPAYTYNMDLYSTGTNWTAVQGFIKYTLIAATETARRGECRTAMEMAVLPMRYTRAERPLNTLEEFLRVMAVARSAEIIPVIARQCNDIEALRHGLDLLDELRPAAEPLTVEHWELANLAGSLYRANSFGYPMELRNQTMTMLLYQQLDIMSGAYGQWAMENFPPEDPRYEMGAVQTDPAVWDESALKGHSIMVRSTPFVRAVFGVSLGQMLATITDLTEAGVRDQVAAAQYRLAQLFLAQRVIELTQGEATARDVNAVAAQLGEIPADPFSTGPMLFHDEKGIFYSVGPDGEDNATEALFDITNGTHSEGDIYCKR